MTTVISHSIAGTGHYKSPHGFENDANAADPYGWTTTEVLGTIAVGASYTTHNKVVDQSRTATGGGNISLINTFVSAQGYGTIECWFATTDVTKINVLVVKGGSDNAIIIEQSGSNFYAYNGNGIGGGAYSAALVAAANATWYRIRIDFECTAGGYLGMGQYKWSLWINGTEYDNAGAHWGFTNNQATLTTFYTQLASNNAYHSYMDGVGYSWDSGYALGDNNTEYTSVPYKRALARRGTHESHHDFSSFDITKMSFPQQL